VTVPLLSLDALPKAPPGRIVVRALRLRRRVGCEPGEQQYGDQDRLGHLAPKERPFGRCQLAAIIAARE
jgi:hypothetical protein